MIIPLESGDEVVSSAPFRDFVLVFSKFGHIYMIQFDHAISKFAVQKLS